MVFGLCDPKTPRANKSGFLAIASVEGLDVTDVVEPVRSADLGELQMQSGTVKFGMFFSTPVLLPSMGKRIQVHTSHTMADREMTLQMTSGTLLNPYLYSWHPWEMGTCIRGFFHGYLCKHPRVWTLYSASLATSQRLWDCQLYRGEGQGMHTSTHIPAEFQGFLVAKKIMIRAKTDLPSPSVVTECLAIFNKARCIPIHLPASRIGSNLRPRGGGGSQSWIRVVKRESTLPERARCMPAFLHRFQKADLRNVEIIEPVDCKFIVCLINNTLVLIDQHAADERVLVEQFLKQLWDLYLGF
ncbi:hypothetical protein C8F01DRAFT_1092311 [Mycena amicta]|nr:hypothetical protein C8F01DRAFT_1092311 [Mycena amicta]